ncbi:hypothetical protein SARC_00932 [Sphaeroforma arctica JP610]|uniref:Uncharacterized protein n=1 Tax=Sphaeroforma arctica JP610 TaxID=667725 RepID=A0A0L0GD41_9EUKA|nr:hypothetical protein SARC_00932 [Sphaeroforma arctica JP610]KNC86930.1 hypothetical protein SARC_00932 [Sphaeroforma arctica JP610]|eukprot:XP_014160832.1 hypothetical protein SARC_00932 [Sphaeroforma arctica JP610]
MFSMSSLWTFLLLTVVSVIAVRLDGTSISGQMEKTASVASIRVRYGVIVDCGSTGTRFKVYRWNLPHDDALPLISQVKDLAGQPASFRSQPGLADAATQAGFRKYITDGLVFAADLIPERHHKHTHVYMYATAGMRILPVKESLGVWKRVHEILESKDNKFLFTSRKWARTITGEEEALFDWISTAYIHDYLAVGAKGTPITGALDMGGASFQIAYQTLPAPLPNFTELKMALNEYNLYTNSYLGWGKNEAKKQHFYRIAAKKGPGVTHFSDPCFWHNSHQEVQIQNSTYHVYGTGKYNECKLYLSELMEKNSYCAVKPCAIRGVYQPKVPADIDLYAMDNFYRAAETMGCDGLNPISCLDEKAAPICNSLSWEEAKKWQASNGTHPVDEATAREACFSAAYVSTLLVEGLNLSPDRKIHFLSKLASTDMDWTMGAMVYNSVEASHT